MSALFIGLMSGTSLDGIDGVVADFAPAGIAPVRIVAHAKRAFAPALRVQLATLNRSGDDEIHRAALAANALARDYAALVETLLVGARLRAQDIAAIGAHGQTVRHRPDSGYTVQLNAPALLAELTGIDVVADFRSRDVAAGGQGAPLVPPFHAAVFGAPQGRAVLNLGGIANVTLLAPGQAPRGFDTGPANVFLDGWCQRHLGQPVRRRRRDRRARPGRPTPARSAARRAVLRAGAAEEHGAGPLQRAMARCPPRRGRCPRQAAPGGRAGHLAAPDGPHRRRAVPSPCDRGARARRLRRRRLQRRSDARARGVSPRTDGRWSPPTRWVFQRSRSRRWPSPGWHTPSSSVAPATCRRRRVPTGLASSARSTRPADGRSARSDAQKSRLAGGFVVERNDQRARLRQKSSSRSRRSWSRSDS